MAERCLVFKFEYVEQAFYPNVWEQTPIEDGVPWFGPPNTFHPWINFGHGECLFDINDPAFQSAPDMPAHDFSVEPLNPRQPVQRSVVMRFILTLGDGEPSDGENLERLQAKARRLAKGVMTHFYPGAALA
jgi:hypothetical protein